MARRNRIFSQHLILLLSFIKFCKYKIFMLRQSVVKHSFFSVHGQSILLTINYQLPKNDLFFSSKIPLICVCDKPSQDDQTQLVEREEAREVLRPLQSDLYKSVSSASSSSEPPSAKSRWSSDFVENDVITLSSLLRIRSSGSRSDEKLLFPNNVNIRSPFLRTTQADYPPSSSYSPSSVLSTSSSMRLSTQNNSPQSKVTPATVCSRSSPTQTFRPSHWTVLPGTTSQHSIKSTR